MKSFFTHVATLLTGVMFLFAITGLHAQFVVTNTNDSGPGSLRDAIIQANINPGHNTITFNLTGGGPNAVYTIAPITQLPPLLDNAGTTIDGFSQPDGTGGGGTATPGANPPSSAVLYIELAGIGIQGTPANGIVVASDSNLVQGLIINRFGEDGIRIESGGSLEPSANHNTIYCNFVGTDPTGALDLGNGVLMSSLTAGITVKNVMGGVTLHNRILRNLSSGNFAEGIQVIGPVQPGDVGFTDVVGNYVGTDVQGLLPIGNDREGILLVEGTHDNVVDSNLVSANLWDGIGVVGFNNVQFDTSAIYTQFNTISNNIIGLDVSFSPLANGKCGVSLGIYGFGGNFGYAYHNDVIFNTIAHNGDNGVVVWEDPTVGPFASPTANADENLISMNSIYNNTNLGIDLDDDGITLNDPSDPDVQANQQCNFPVITSATISGGTTTITGTVDIPSPAAGNVEVYIANPDPSGFGEGQVFLGSARPDAAGNWVIQTGVTVATTDQLTALAIDQSNNTSEFSNNFMGVVLPIRLLAFRAQAKGMSIILDWEVGDTQDGVVYEVQRAASEMTFGFIGKVHASEGLTDRNFTFVDSAIQQGITYYYRLKIISVNGDFEYSPIESAKVDGMTLTSLYPNPTTGQVNIQFFSENDGDVHVSIFNARGRLVRQFEIAVIDGFHNESLDLMDLAPGAYWISIDNNGARTTRELIIQ